MDNIDIARKDVHDLVCVSLDIHLWSGRKRLRKEQLIERNPALGNLPPESLATLGAIKICDPDDLAPFMAVKRQAEKLLAGNGLPLLGTWGIPDAKLESVHKHLTKLQGEFDQLRKELHRDYAVRIDEWRCKPENIGWQHLISDIPTPEYVAGRLSFGFHMVRVLAPSSDEGSAVNQSFNAQVGGLKGELFSDAAREARVLMDKYLMGRNAAGVVSEREKITQKTLRPLRRIAEKLRSFSFLDPTVEPMAEVIEHCLSLLPSEGPIEGSNLVHIWTLARTIANERAAEEAAALAIHLGSAGEAFESLLLRAGEPADVVKDVPPADGVPAAPATLEGVAAAANPSAPATVGLEAFAGLQDAFF